MKQNHQPEFKYTIRAFSKIIEYIPIEDIQKISSMKIHPKDVILNTMFIASPMIRPNRKSAA